MRNPLNFVVAFCALIVAAMAAPNLFDDGFDFVDLFSQHLKRDDLSVELIEQIIHQVNDTGIITTVLDGLAASNSLQETIVNAAAGFIRNGSNPLAGYNISLNVSDVIQKVNHSGLIQLTLNDLVVNDNNRNYLADRAGEFLSKEIWVSVILRDIGNGHKLSAKWIADTARNFKPYRRDQNKKQTVLKATSDTSSSSSSGDDQYAGSAQKFFNNFINAALDSDLVNESLDDILKALNNTGIISSVVLQVLHDDAILQMAGNIILKLYDTGALDDVNLQYYFETAKKKGYMSKGVTKVFTDPTYSPYVAKLFQRMDSDGVFKNIQYGLYGTGEGGYF